MSGETRAFLRPGAHQAAQLGLAAAALLGAGWALHALLGARAEAAVAAPPELQRRLDAIEERLGSIDRRLTVVQTQLEERTLPAALRKPAP